MVYVFWMRIFIALFFVGLGVRAELFEGVTEDYCDSQWYDCSEASADIVKNYRAGQGVELNGDELLYAGSCYMVSRHYHKDHAHHGYFYFRKNAGAVDFFGLLSFFSEENPYENLTLEDARQLNPKASQYQIKISQSEWRVDTNIEPPWQYFMRELNSKLYVVGFWGYDDSINCEFTKK